MVVSTVWMLTALGESNLQRARRAVPPDSPDFNYTRQAYPAARAAAQEPRKEDCGETLRRIRLPVWHSVRCAGEFGGVQKERLRHDRRPENANGHPDRTHAITFRKIWHKPAANPGWIRQRQHQFRGILSLKPR